MSADEFHKKLMSFGPEGPPLDWDPRGLEVDESSIGPRKTMRGTGFPAEDSPMAMINQRHMSLAAITRSS